MVQRAKGTVPVLVGYNIPCRDCAQFSAGGATNTADYPVWIDGFAAGTGDAGDRDPRAGWARDDPVTTSTCGVYTSGASRPTQYAAMVDTGLPSDHNHGAPVDR